MRGELEVKPHSCTNADQLSRSAPSRTAGSVQSSSDTTLAPDDRVASMSQPGPSPAPAGRCCPTNEFLGSVFGVRY